MIDKQLLEKVDSFRMHEVYDKWPEIAREYYETNFEKINFDEITHIVFAGMGGSGTIGDIFAAILSKTNIHVDVVKGYLLPKTVNSKSLIITTGVSGNTEETLNVLYNAFKLKCKIIAFSDGGKMEKYCYEKRLNHRKIKMIHSPRASFPAFLFAILKTLESFLPIEKKDIINSLEELEKQRDDISSHNLNEKNGAINLAESISDVPLIYYPWGLQATAIRFKNSLQENTKIHAISEDVIEACHNGIVSWSKFSEIKPILVRGKDDYIKTIERWEILKDYFEKEEIDYEEVFSVSGSILSKLINLIYLFDYTSIYKATLMGVDPTPVKAIDYVKERL